MPCARASARPSHPTLDGRVRPATGEDHHGKSVDVDAGDGGRSGRGSRRELRRTRVAIHRRSQLADIHQGRKQQQTGRGRGTAELWVEAGNTAASEDEEAGPDRTPRWTERGPQGEPGSCCGGGRDGRQGEIKAAAARHPRRLHGRGSLPKRSVGFGCSVIFDSCTTCVLLFCFMLLTKGFALWLFAFVNFTLYQLYCTSGVHVYLVFRINGSVLYLFTCLEFGLHLCTACLTLVSTTRS